MDALRKICQNLGFCLFAERIFDSVLIREYMGQEKPVFWHVLHSDAYLYLFNSKILNKLFITLIFKIP